MSAVPVDRIPPQLAYLVIFNPTIECESREDDDIEAAHILFYNAHSRAVSRDTMLRQVGLAKALINFAGLFTPESSCDSVHSQQKRMIMVNPEPNFWIHACVDLGRIARLPAAPDPKGKGKGKASPKDTPPLDTYDYLDNATLDAVLKVQLMRGYDEFKLLHGTFEDSLRRNRTSLEHRLERFFQVWASNWDVGNALNLVDHLGLPLSPHHERLGNIAFQLFDENLPSTSIPLLLSHNPPCLLTSPASWPVYPSALPRYLLTIYQPKPQPSLKPSPSQDSTSSKSPQPASSSSSSSASPFLPPVLNPLNLSLNPLNLTNPFHSLSSPKKWSWPGYLTVKKSDSPALGPSPLATPSLSQPEPTVTVQEDSTTAGQDDEVPPISLVPSTPEATLSTSEATVSATVIPAEESEAPVEADLATPGESPSEASSPVPSSRAESDSPIKASGSPLELAEEPTDTNSPPKGIAPLTQQLLRNIITASATPSPSASPEKQALDLPLLTSDAVSISMHSHSEAELTEEIREAQETPLPPSTPLPAPPLTELPVFISTPGGNGEGEEQTEERMVLHAHNYGLTFAVLVPHGELRHDPDRRLEEQVDVTLFKLREALDAIEAESANPLLLSSSSAPLSTASTKSITYDSRSHSTRVYPLEKQEYTGNIHLFEAESVLNSYPSPLHEYITRTTSNQWYAAKNLRNFFTSVDDEHLSNNHASPTEYGNGSGKTKEKERERDTQVYVEIGNTGASLVDVQMEVDGIVKRWFGKS